MKIAYMELARHERRRFEKVFIRVEYHFKDNQKRDLDNYSGKPIHDALCYAGIIRGDSADICRIAVPEILLGQPELKTVIELSDLEKESTNGKA